MAYEQAHSYNDPAGGTDSNVGVQMNDFFYQKKALMDIKKEQYYQPLASSIAMP